MAAGAAADRAGGVNFVDKDSLMDIVEVDTTQGIKPALITLLQDSVASGASVGFLPPLTEQGARLLAGHRAELAAGGRRLWVAFLQHQLVGALQLSLCTKANGRHRARWKN